jgi:hypothetical protein
MKWILTALLLGCLLGNGCVIVRKGSNEPVEAKVRIESQALEGLHIHIEKQEDVPVPFDGRVVVSIPQFPPACETRLFGWIRINDEAAKRLVYVKRGDRVVKKISLDDFERLPVDGDGYRIMKAGK